MVARWRAAALVGTLCLCGLGGGTLGGQAPQQFQKGDVFASVSLGRIDVYRRDPVTGTYITLDNPARPFGRLTTRQFRLSTGTAVTTTGSAFDKQGNFYVTTFVDGGVKGVYKFVRDFNPAVNTPTSFNTGGDGPESILVDAAGNLYVGHSHGPHDEIRKFTADGQPTGSPDNVFDAEPDFKGGVREGTDWIDIAADQRTMYYTSEGRRIRRYDLVTRTQLPDFIDLSPTDPPNPPNKLYAIRLLPDGRVLAADNVDVKLLSADETLPAQSRILRRYDVPAGNDLNVPDHNNWFSLNLDPITPSFWSGDSTTGIIHKFDIATGARLESIFTGAAGQLFGVSVFEEITQGTAVGSVSGLVYVDTNKNGQHDAGEAGIAGVTVALSGGSGGTTVTASDGTYSFANLAAGDYSVSSPPSAADRQLYTQSPRTFTLTAGENKTGVDFGYVSGSISGFAYVDTDRNSVRDPGEPAIANVEITLGGAVSSTTLTGPDGSYRFNFVPPGNYTSAGPSVAGGKGLHTPSPIDVVLGLGVDKTDVNFGYVPGAISGFVYIDTNGNGVRNAGEPGIGAVTVTGPGGTTTTAADGSYSFPNLDAGPYSVSAPPTANGKGLSTASPLTPTVIAGQTTSDVNFGYVPGAIAGFVYVDTNGNGVRNAGEPGIGAVVVTGPGGTTTTAADGSYSFPNLDAGPYSVSAPPTANGKGLSTASPLTPTVIAGQTTSDVNFGYVQGAISGFVYVDTNGNGVRNAGEPGIAAVIVTGPGGATTTTAADGSYSFLNLDAGPHSVSAPATANGKGLSTASPLTPTVIAGQTTADVNFGYVQGAISGFVYVDTNGNGVRNAGEPGIDAVTVTGPGGTTTTTAADGSYSFPNLDAGSYSVSAPPTATGKGLSTASPLTPTVIAGQPISDVNFGYVPGAIAGFVYVDTNGNGVRNAGEPGIGAVVVTGPGGTTTTAADGSYSFPNLDAGPYSVSAPPTANGKGLSTASPLTPTVIAGQTTSDVNFGYVQGAISGFVYVDTNGNGVRNAGEPGIAAVIVTGPGGATTTTAADGSYSFLNLDAGPYSVSAPATANGKGLSTASPLTPTVIAGQTTSDVNFGYVPGAIAGFVYVDTNGNGVRNAGEPGIGAVTVTGPGGTTTTTAADGSYSFPNLDAGSYSVSAPPTATGKGLSTASPLTPTVIAGQTISDVNFGYVPGAIAGFVYVDTNGNGVRNAGEPGIGAVIVTGPGGATTTAADGSYSFLNLDAGPHSVSAPATANGKGLSTASPLTATVIAGQTTSDVNFGYVPGAITGFVYVDTNGNGVRNAGEPGIGDVIVTGPGGTTTTAADGSYGFVNLDGGVYSVSAPPTAGVNLLETPSPLSVTVAPGQITPNVNFGYIVPTPHLSLSKTPSPAVYSAVGQTIRYTYVLQNTGTVTLTAPFVIADDKLGSFQCGSATSLAPGASVSCTATHTIRAAELGTVSELPTRVRATVNTGLWLQGLVSTQDTTISGAAGVPSNTVYPGWCIQDHVWIDLHNEPATLYSSIGGSLPSDVAGLPWNQINYVLNHKIRGPGKNDLAFFKDVQTAIWLLLGEKNPDFGVSPEARQMVREAQAHSDFVPGPSDVVAVIIYSDGMGTDQWSMQESIVEMKPPQSITNHAVATAIFGTSVVQSNPAQATVTQVFGGNSASTGPGPQATRDRVVHSDGQGNRRTAAFSTADRGQLLVAFAASDGPQSAKQSLTIAGGGLNWTLVQRANLQPGTSEVWKAWSPGRIVDMTVTSTQKIGGYDQSLTVVGFNDATDVGASAFAGGSSGAPGASLTTTASGSVVYAVGNDWDRALARTLGSGQSMVHEWVDTAVGDTFWVQSLAAPVTSAGKRVQINATAPTRDRWNLVIVEIVR